MKKNIKLEMVDNSTIVGTVSWTMTKESIKAYYDGNKELSDDDIIKWGNMVNLFFASQFEIASLKISTNFQDWLKSYSEDLHSLVHESEIY